MAPGDEQGQSKALRHPGNPECPIEDGFSRFENRLVVRHPWLTLTLVKPENVEKVEVSFCSIYYLYVVFVECVQKK